MHPELLYLNSLLVKVGRRVPPVVAKQIASGELIKIASRRFVLRKDIVQLRNYQRRILMTLAAAQSVNSSYLLGSSAARLHGMWTIDESEPILLATKSGTVPPRTKWPSGCTYLRQATAPEQVVEILGATAIDPVGAWLQIATTQGFPAGLVAADWLLANNFTVLELRKRIDQAGVQKGIHHARRSLEHAIPNSDSAGESFARALLIEAGIGPLVAQAQVVAPFSIDILVAGKIAIEIDGDIKYSQNPDTAIKQERFREKLIQNKGYRILRYSPAQLHARPEAFIAEVRRALEHAA